MTTTTKFTETEKGKQYAYKRLMKKIEAIPMCGCWIFLGAINEYGYGYLMINKKLLKAHRASWILHRGPIPDGLQVLHHCDVPTCVNPAHLFLGTRTSNMRDMAAKKRQALQAHPEMIMRGEDSGMSKLTDREVVLIRARIAAGEKSISIAQDFGVTRGTINHIKKGHTWKHIMGNGHEIH